MMVVPEVMAHWKYVAYALRYKTPTIHAIEAKCRSDPKDCCTELFTNWLTTRNGIKPKTWETLLKQLGEVDELTAAVETIKEKISST